MKRRSGMPPRTTRIARGTTRIRPKKRSKAESEQVAADESEQWTAVPGWPYEVSTVGRVRSMGGRSGAIAGRILRPQTVFGRPTAKPYHTITMRDYPRVRIVYVHVLVLECFAGPRPSPTHQGNHIDGDKFNNAVSNLEWVTPSENARHAVRTGLKRPNISRSKLAASDIPVIRARHAAGERSGALAREYGVHVDSITNAVTRRTWWRVA